MGADETNAAETKPPVRIRALYVADDDHPEGWIPFLRDIVGYERIVNAAGDERLVALVADGYIGSGEISAADSLPGFVTIVDDTMPIQEIVTACREYMAEQVEMAEKSDKEPSLSN